MKTSLPTVIVPIKRSCVAAPFLKKMILGLEGFDLVAAIG